MTHTFTRDGGAELDLGEFAWLDRIGEIRVRGVVAWRCGHPGTEFMMTGSEADRWKACFVPDPSDPEALRAGPVLYYLLDGRALNVARCAALSPTSIGEVGVDPQLAYRAAPAAMAKFLALLPLALSLRGLCGQSTFLVGGKLVKLVKWAELGKTHRLGDVVRVDWRDYVLVGFDTLGARTDLAGLILRDPDSSDPASAG